VVLIQYRLLSNYVHSRVPNMNEMFVIIFIIKSVQIKDKKNLQSVFLHHGF